MASYTFSLPIYYTQEFKTKNNKQILLGMNWYNKAHYQLKNKIKQHYHSLVGDQSLEIPQVQTFKLDYVVHYKRTNIDVSNVVAVIEKFFLDGLKEHKVIVDDNLKHHLGSSWSVGEHSKDNPRIEITLTEVK